MWAKIENESVSKYPYFLSDLQADNRNVSFSLPLSAETKAFFGVVDVVAVPVPPVTYAQNVAEGTPSFDGTVWKQTWVVTNKPADEVAAIAEQKRRDAYTVEADPIFFKWQRNEATQQEWLDKIAEIKARFPE